MFSFDGQMFSSTDELVRRVVIQCDISLLPRTERLVWGKVEGLLETEIEGLVEPSLSLSDNCNVLVARVLTTVRDGVTPLRLINLGVEPQVLHKGMKVGELSVRTTVVNNYSSPSVVDEQGQVSELTVGSV